MFTMLIILAVILYVSVAFSSLLYFTMMTDVDTVVTSLWAIIWPISVPVSFIFILYLWVMED